MAKYKMTAVLATPKVLDDQDFVYVLEFENKKGLHRVERALVNGLMTLVKLTENELETGKKAFEGTDPQLVTFTTDIEKEDGSDFGGYAFRWPNQTKEARAFLKGLIDGIMADTGHGNKKQLRGKNG